MKIRATTLTAFSLLLATMVGSPAPAADLSLLPKYGSQPKNEAQLAADESFMKSIDEYYKGDRKKGAQDVSSRAWQFLRQGNAKDAMRRFNQAWLLDPSNGSALWGMATLQASTGKVPDSLKLFAEAESLMGEDVDFAVDYAKAVGLAAAQAKNDALFEDAFTRFARVHERAPEHVENLQNWAITLFYVGDFAEAWKKIKVAEGTPRSSELDQRFISALQTKMPRP